MQAKSQQAIRVMRAAEGWTWTLFDAQGEAQAQGAAHRQQEAMEAAWQAARSARGHAPRIYPEIIVDQEDAAA